MVGHVQQIFDPAVLSDVQLVADRLLHDHVVRLLSRQALVDVLRRPHGVHLVGLRGHGRGVKITAAPLSSRTPE